MNGLVGGPLLVGGLGPPLKSGRGLLCKAVFFVNRNENKTKRMVVRLQISGMTGVLSFWDRSSAMRPPPGGGGCPGLKAGAKVGRH